MDFRIERRGAIRLTGLAVRVSTDQARITKELTAFWERIREAGSLAALLRAVPAASPWGCLGVSLDDFDVRTRDFTYLAAIEKPDDFKRLPPGCVDATAEAGAWAVFKIRGALPAGLRDMWKRIFQDWFPASGYEQRPGPVLEAYPDGDTRSPDYTCEVWVPVNEPTGK